MKGATYVVQGLSAALRVSIHAPNEGSDRVPVFLDIGLDVSIHAPNEGSDAVIPEVKCVYEVSIHAPNEGSDFLGGDILGVQMVFQSTLPMKGATTTH